MLRVSSYSFRKNKEQTFCKVCLGKNKYSAIIYLNGMLTALVLLMLGIWNGGAIPYPDTYNYLSPPAYLLTKAAPSIFHADFRKINKVDIKVGEYSPLGVFLPKSGTASTRFMSGRSPYWGAIAFVIYSFAGFSGIMVGNAIVLGLALALAWSRGMNLRFGWSYYTACVILAVFTPAGVFVSFLTPDILAPVLIVSLALLIARWNQLSLGDCVMLSTFTCIATVSHDSHLVIAFVIAVLGLVLHISYRRRAWDARVAAMLAPLVVGVIAMIALGFVAKAQTGYPPMRLPFISAHLSDIPAANAYLEDACPEAEFELCNHLPEIANGTWIDFLFKPSDRGGVFLASSQPVRDRLIAEQGKVLLGAVRSRPFSITAAFLLDGLKQLFIVDLREIEPSQHFDVLRGLFHTNTLHGFQQTRIFRYPSIFIIFDSIQEFVALLSIALITFTIWRSWKLLVKRNTSLGMFALFIMTGILANGVLCGLLVSPLGRFQARVMFLSVFLTLGIAASSMASMKDRSPRS